MDETKVAGVFNFETKKPELTYSVDEQANVYDVEVVKPKINTEGMQGAFNALGELYNQPAPVVFHGDGAQTTNLTNFGTGKTRYDVEQQEEYGFAETAKAFIQTENIVVSYITDESSGKEYKVGYDVTDTQEYMQASPELKQFLINSRSDNETQGILNDYQRETRNREIMESTSFMGRLGFTTLAWATDPVFLPLMLASGSSALYGRTALQTGARFGAASGVTESIAEVAKHGTQDLRTIEESMINIGAATIIAAGLAGAGKGLSAKQINDIGTKVEKELAAGPDTPMQVKETPVKTAQQNVGDSVGAAKVDPYNIADAEDYELVSTGTFLEKLPANPLVRLSQSPIPMAKMVAVMLADSPYYYKGHLKGKSLGDPKGTIESQKRQMVGKYIKTMNDVEKVFLEARGETGILASTKTAIKDVTGKSAKEGKVTWDDFKSQVSDSLRGIESNDPHVTNAAKIVRKELLNPFLQAGKEAGIFDENIDKFADTYFPRLFNRDVLAKETFETEGGLGSKLTTWLLGQQQVYKDGKARYVNEVNQHMADVDKTKMFIDYNKMRNESIAEESRAIKALLRYDIDTSNPDDIKSALKLEKRPLSLAAFMRKRGGLNDAGGEYSSRDVNNKTYAGLIKDEGGIGIDEARQLAFDNGYYPNLSSYNDIPASQFYDDIASDSNGERIWTAEIREGLNEVYYQQQNEAFVLAKQDGLDRLSSLDVIQSAVKKRTGHKFTDADMEMYKGRLNTYENALKLAQEEADGFSEFADMTVGQVKNIARQVFDNIQGQKMNEFKIDLLPKEGPFKAGPLKKRTLTIDDREIREYLVNDLDQVLQFYSKSVSPQILLAQKYGSADLSAMFDQLGSKWDAHKRKVETDMKAAGKAQLDIDKAINKLNKQERSNNKDLMALRDKLLGQYNMPNDPDSFWYRAGEFTKRLNFMRMLGGMTISAIPDLARPIMTQGLGPTMSTVYNLAKNKQLWKGAVEDLREAGTAWDMLSNNRLNSIADLQDYSLNRTKFERGTMVLSDVFGKATGMPLWNDTLKGFSGINIQSQMLKAIEAQAAGKATKRQVRELAKYGLNEDYQRLISAQIKKYGTQEGGLRLPNANKWDDPDLQTAWRSAVGKAVDETIVTPSIGEMPLWVSGPVAQQVMQFKSFALSAHNKVLISGLQARDKAALEGLLLASFMGSMVYTFKAWENDRPIADNPGDFIYESIDRAGVLGWLNEPIQMASKMTGGVVNPARLWGSNTTGVSRYASRNVLGILGPSTDLAGDFASVTRAIATGERTEGDARAMRKLLPMQNLFYFRWLFDQTGLSQSISESVANR